MGVHALSVVLGLLIAPVVLALLTFMINFATRIEYKVHSPHSSAIIVTGASTGIGRHAAEELARLGFDVYASVRSDADEADLRKMGLPSLIPFRLDVANNQSRITAIEHVKSAVNKTGKKLIGLVNNAGVSSGLPAELHPLTDARFMFDVNFFGMMHITQLVLPSLRKNEGRVIQLSSIAGRVSTRTRAIYGSTKFAMEAFSDALRMELVPWKISVSVIEPGYVQSAIAQSGVARVGALSTDEKKAQELYPHLYPPGWQEENIRKISHGDPPTVTTTAIVDALTNAFPATRYPVAKGGGVDAKVVVSVLPLLPDRLRDLMLINLG